MALPLKSGADFYTQQALRMALHNEMADLSDHIPGSIYFNNHDTSSLSDRVRYRGLKDWHSVANMEDIEDVKDLIKALSGSLSESVASVLGRVITLEGYFSNGVAKDAELLDGHNSDYFATASGLSALQEKVSAFLDGEADSDAVLENLKEIQAFLDSYDGATSLADMFGAVNTQIADRYTKAEADARYLKLTGGELTGQLKINAPNWAQQLILDTTSNSSGIRFNVNGSLSGVLRSTGGYLQWYVKDGEDYILLHSGNYSDLITTLNGNLSVGGNLTVSGNSINLGNADSITAVAGTFSVNKSATFKENVFFTSAEGVYINRTSINWGKEFGFVSPLINFAADQITVKQKATIEGDLYVTGHIIADGQVSSGGIGSEGSGSGASGIVILEDWEKYDDTLAQVLGAGLGVGLRDKIAALESKATNVSVAQTLTSGKEIGAITIDGVATKLFAPDDYLPLSGGVIKGSLEKRLPTENATQNYILFTRHNGTAQGYLGFNGVDNPIYIPSAANAIYTLLHSGNFNSYAPTLTGVGASGTWGIDISKSARYLSQEYLEDLEGTDDLKTSPITGKGLFVGVTGASAFGDVDAYSTSLFIGYADYSRVGRFIFRRSDNSGVLYWQTANAGATAWGAKRRIAFTDSDITGNAASATKLQTARTIWGNSFDGTANINGDIHLAADKGIVASNGYTVLTAPSYLLLGYAQSELGQTTYLDGNDIYLRYGKNHVPAMYINSSGNVTIGASDYAQQNCKLFVDGAINVGTYGALHRDVNNHLWVNYGGSAAEKNLIICGYNTSFYYGKGSNYQSAMFISSSGNVGIGTTSPQHKLHVCGASTSSNPLCVESANTWGESSIAFKSKSGYLWTAGLSVGINNSDHFGFYSDTAKKVISRITPTGMVVDGDIRVTGNIIADGQVSSGGVAEEGTGGATGGSGLDRVVFTIPAQTTSFSCEHNLGTREISVAIYEEGNDYQQVLTDVYLDSTNIARIVFGSATDVAHKVVIIG